MDAYRLAGAASLAGVIPGTTSGLLARGRVAFDGRYRTGLGGSGPQLGGASVAWVTVTGQGRDVTSVVPVGRPGKLTVALDVTDSSRWD